jgi:hypothetical protein
MFAKDDDAAEKAEAAAEWFGNAAEFLSHGRPVRREEAREHGIEVKDLEDDGELQDAVLSVHHAALISMEEVPIVKLIENNRDGDACRSYGSSRSPQAQSCYLRGSHREDHL